MLHAFYYPPSAVGLSEFAPGYFKFDPAVIAPTDDPARADVFVCATDIRHITDAQICALPYLRGNEARHVFFSLSENPKRALPINALAFRTDHNQRLRDAGNTYARTWAWGVDDLSDYVKLPADGFAFDVHAQMWASTPLTDETVESCKRAGLTVHDRRNHFFYGTLETNKDERLAELRQTFLDTMRVSRLVLVPRSRAGVNRYRFFEAMSCGRVPVLFCDECLLPCADKIDYTRCSIKINERDAAWTGTILKEWLSSHTGHELIEMGLYGRVMWNRYLNSQRWESVWGELTVEHLEGLGK